MRFKSLQEKFERENFIDTTKSVWNYSLLSEEDIAHFQNGDHCTLYERFGSHPLQVNNVWGMYFCVWAPGAQSVFVTGNFNNWNKSSHPLFPRWDHSGIWEGLIPNVNLGEVYQYHIVGAHNTIGNKGDPFGRFWETQPSRSTITWDAHYNWQDEQWMNKRKSHNALNAPWSIYEVHLASWQRPSDGHTYNTYDQIRERLIPYVKKMGFTHVELMPVAEHPFDGSWGYQITGYYAPTSRFGDPQGFMRLIDAFHQEEIGVILDWVPAHFPHDAHGLYMFDGAHTYEYADKQKGFHPDWNSYIFNYKRGEVVSFLLSNARFWLDVFHIDGLRVDAVSSMLKLNYSRKEGEWEPNEYGGDGNLEAIRFIKKFNKMVYRDFPDVQTIAEEATDWPGVSKPTCEDGLGFGMKWMMGWMHDSLNYFKQEPARRKDHQDQFTFSMMYYYDENFVLPISHDEVVHGKSPLLYKMPGDLWQKFANLRLFFTYMWTHPGAKLLFMGNEFGQTSEWNDQSELDWSLLKHNSHAGVQQCLQQLNDLLKKEPALYILQFDPNGFEWVDLNHREACIFVYKRKGEQPEDDLLVILNMTPEVHYNWAVIVSDKNYTQEIFNSDHSHFGGTGDIINTHIHSELIDAESRQYRIRLHIPPLAGLILK